MTALTANTPATKAAKKTTAKKPTSAKAWKQASAEPIELPSGNYMRVRRIGMQTLMATGKMPNALMNIVRSAVDKGTGMDGVDMADVVGDEKQLAEMMKFMDDLCCMVSVDPKVHPIPKNEADRDDETLYADEVDMDDKSFLFQLVTGGTTDLEQFRAATDANVAAVSGLQNVELPAVGTAGA